MITNPKGNVLRDHYFKNDRQKKSPDTVYKLDSERHPNSSLSPFVPFEWLNSGFHQMMQHSIQTFVPHQQEWIGNVELFRGWGNTNICDSVEKTSQQRYYQETWLWIKLTSHHKNEKRKMVTHFSKSIISRHLSESDYIRMKFWYFTRIIWCLDWWMRRLRFRN